MRCELLRGRKFLLMGSVLACLGASAAEVYRWTDENGRTVFSSNAPGDRPSSKTVVKASPAKPAQSRAASADPTGEQPTARTDQAAPKPVPPDPETAAHNCAEARRVLEVLETTPRPRFTDSDGQIKFMDERQKEERRAEARRLAAENCR